MKYKVEIVIILVILIIVSSLELITSSITNNVIDESFNKIENIKKELKKENNDEDKIYNLLSFWNKEKMKMSLYIEHDELEKVGNIFARLKENAENEEFEEGLENIEEAKFLLDHIREKGHTNVQNIF